MKTFRIALAQINTIVGDLYGNSDKIISFIKKAESVCADLVVFPELSVTGYPPEDLLLKKSFIAANLSEVKRIASHTGNITAVVGYADKKSSLFNAAGLLRAGKLRASYHKTVLPNYGVFDEKRYFEPGSESPVFLIGDVRVGITICEDMWDDSGPVRRLARTGRAELIINLSSSPYHRGKLLMRKKMLSGRAKENRVFIAYSNLVGGQDELVFDGGSFLFGPDGKLLAMAKQFEEELLIADLPAGDARAVKNTPPPTLPRRKRRRMGEMEEVYSALVLGLRDYAGKNGFKQAVLGLSGGIDSALTAVIAADALGRENVIAITMPSAVSSKGSVADSKRLSKNLGIRLETIPIASLVTSYIRSLRPLFRGTSEDTTEENIQSRVRGNLLMSLSNKFGWLVLATGNKSEISTGYCTLYGDMAGGFAVIKDVPKTMVYRLSRYRNSKAGSDLIPLPILTKEPSAELRPDQKDTDSLPPYPALDPVLRDYVEKDRDLFSIAKKSGDAKTVKRIIEMVDSNEYKRRQAPPGVKITPKAFGKDRRLPITNHFSTTKRSNRE